VVRRECVASLASFGVTPADLSPPNRSEETTTQYAVYHYLDGINKGAGSECGNAEYPGRYVNYVAFATPTVTAHSGFKWLWSLIFD
jgi:hypothetical protein